MTMADPAPYLVPYQQRWLLDQSHRKCLVKSRRVGGSEVLAIDIAMAAVGIDPVTRSMCEPRNQAIVSASWPQAKKLLARVVKIIRAFERATGPLLASEPAATMVRLRNGRTLEAFSTRAASLRGDAADVSLDEFAAMPHAEEMWAAAQPMTAPTLGNRHGYKLRVCFTPLGDDNMAYRVAKGDLAESFSVHEVTIHQAIFEGFPLRGTIDDLREEVGDPDIFAQEYECSFLSANMQYISAELYDRSLYHDAAEIPAIVGANFAGMDVARKRHNSAIVRATKRGETLWHLGTEARREEPWDAQEAWVANGMADTRRMCVDVSGLGSQFGERLIAQHGSSIEGVEFTAQVKEALANGLKLAFERKLLRMRADDTATRRDVLSLRRVVTDAGNIRFDTRETEDGHGDRGWALALCVEAAGGFTRAATTKAPENVASHARAALGESRGARSRL